LGAFGAACPRRANTGGFAYTCNENHYVNSSGHWVHSPSYGTEPNHQEAVCSDGSVLFSEHCRETGSHHGDVEYWE